MSTIRPLYFQLTYSMTCHPKVNFNSLLWLSPRLSGVSIILQEVSERELPSGGDDPISGGCSCLIRLEYLSYKNGIRFAYKAVGGEGCNANGLEGAPPEPDA